MDANCYLDACFNATDKWLEGHEEELQRKLAWVRAIRHNRWEQTTRPATLSNIPSLPQEIVDSMFDLLAEKHGSIKINGEGVDVVADVANELVGPTPEGQTFRGDMEAAILRNCSIIVRADHLLQALETEDGAPILKSRLASARHLIVEAYMQSSGTASRMAFARQQQEKELYKIVTIIQYATEINREERCSKLTSLCVRFIIPTGAAEPETGLEIALRAPDTPPDPARLPDGSQLRECLEYAIKVMQTEVLESPVKRSLQLRARRFWSGNQFALWDGHEIAVKDKSSNEILEEATINLQHVGA